MAYAWDLTFQTTSTPDAASLRNRDGTAYASQPAFTLVNQGNNFWTCYTDGMPDSHQGCVRVTAAGGTVALGLVSPRETENADVLTSTRNATAPLSAVGTRSALGMAAADLDAQLDALSSTAGGAATAGEVASIFAASSAGVLASLSGADLTVRRGDTWEQPVTTLGSVASYQKIWFTVKDRKTLPDSASIIQIEATAGLLYLNGRAATSSSLGSITVDSAALGNLTLSLSEDATALLAKSGQGHYYDIQWKNAAGEVFTLAEGTLAVIDDVTRAV